MNQEEKGIAVGIWMPRELAERLRDLADKERRTLSNLCRLLIEEGLETRND